MLRLVVVNADDFGLHEAVNEGVVRTHREGIVTSASLVACGRAFEDAVRRSRSCPGLGLGVHLTLVEERPVSPAGAIPSLVDPEGLMPPGYRAFARRWLAGTIRKRDVRRELEAQVEKIVETGIRPMHLDSHQHLHCLPGIWRITLDIATKYGVPYVRVPAFDSLWAEARGPVLPMVRAGVNLVGRLRRLAPKRSVKFADQIRGAALSGRMTISRLLEIIDSLRPGLTEVIVHPGLRNEELRRRYPGWGGFDWESDLRAVTDREVLSRCQRGDFVLASFAGHRAESRR